MAQNAASVPQRLLSMGAGLVSALATVYLAQQIARGLYAPVGASTDPIADSPLVAGLPVGAQLMVVLAWFVAAAIGEALTIRLSGWRAGAWLVALLLAAAGALSIMYVPRPGWMQAAAVVAPLLAMLAAGPIAHWSAVRAANRI